MNKRQKKKEEKRLGYGLPFIPKKCTIPISVIKVDLAFTSSEKTLAEAEEKSVLDYNLASTDIKLLAEELGQWIVKFDSTNVPLRYSSKLNVSFGKSLLLNEVPKNPSYPIWFIGDLHGDLAALKILTDFAHAQDYRDKIASPTRLFFLGDFTDDAPFSAEVTAWVMRHCCKSVPTAQEEQSKSNFAAFEVMAVVGNHDDGLCFTEDDTGGKFFSTVSPSSFAEELNQRMKGENGEAWKAFGKAAIEFFKALPRMVLLDKAVMVAHGGVPHSDIPIHEEKDLELPQALSDFVWNRLHETAPKKIPNRESRGSQLGINDFNGFISKLETVFGSAPAIFIRGHDHHEGNFKRYECYKGCSVVTLNAFTVNRCSYGQKYRDLTLLRWSPSDHTKMTLFRLNFQNGALEEMWRTIGPKN